MAIAINIVALGNRLERARRRVRRRARTIAASRSAMPTYRSRRSRPAASSTARARAAATLAPGSLLLGNAGACFECGHAHGARRPLPRLPLPSPASSNAVVADVPGRARCAFAHAVLPALPALMPLLAEAEAARDDGDAGRVRGAGAALRRRRRDPAAHGRRGSRRRAGRPRRAARHRGAAAHRGDAAGTADARGARRRCSD